MKSLILFGFLFTTLLIDLCRCEKINSHLRVASYYNPLAELPDEPVNKIGEMESKLIDILGKFLSFKYEIHVPPDVRQLGSLDETKGNGSWTGVLGQLLRDEVDMSISFGPQLYTRHSIVDISVMVVLDEISIMVPYPVQDTDARGYFNAYTPWTWILITGSSIGIVLALWAIANIQRKGERQLGKIMMFHLAVSTRKGAYLKQNSTYSSASRLIRAAWLLSLLVLSYGFTGILISLITKPRFQFTVDSIEEVAANKNVKPLIIHESSTQAEFEESTYPTFQKVFERIQANPNLLIPPSSNLIDVLLSDPYHVLIVSNFLADSEMEKDFRKNRVCRATILPKHVNVRANSLFLQKDSRYTRLINKKLLLLSQAGLLDYLDNNDETYVSRCYIDKHAMVGYRRDLRPLPLSLYDLRGILRTFAFAFLGNLVVFLSELIYGNCQFFLSS